MQGWISIHRKIKEKSFYKKPEHLLLWVHILLSCNHKKNEILWNNKDIIIHEGSFLTGRKALSSETGINESKIERILKYFENEQQIEQQKTTKFRIIRVINWTLYQNKRGSEQQNEQQVNNKRTTDKQQMNTNNNDNNDNNVNNVNKKDTMSTTKEVTEQILLTWNDFAESNQLPKIKSITKPRKNKLAIRLKEGFNIVEVLKMVGQSDFLKGVNKNNWNITFDWIIENESNYVKIIEGNYTKSAIERKPIKEYR